MNLLIIIVAKFAFRFNKRVKIPIIKGSLILIPLIKVKALCLRGLGTVEELIEILNNDITKSEKSLNYIDRRIGAAGDDQKLIERIEKSVTVTKKCFTISSLDQLVYGLFFKAIACDCSSTTTYEEGVPVVISIVSPFTARFVPKDSEIGRKGTYAVPSTAIAFSNNVLPFTLILYSPKTLFIS